MNQRLTFTAFLQAEYHRSSEGLEQALGRQDMISVFNMGGIGIPNIGGHAVENESAFAVPANIDKSYEQIAASVSELRKEFGFTSKSTSDQPESPRRDTRNEIFAGAPDAMGTSQGIKPYPGVEINASIRGLNAAVYTLQKWMVEFASDKVEREALQLRAIQEELNTGNISETRRLQLLDNLGAQHAIAFKSSVDEKTAYADLNAEINKTVALLENKAVNARMGEAINEVQDIIGSPPISSLAGAFYKAIENTGKLLGEDMVAPVRNDNSLTYEEKMNRLDQMVVAAGYQKDILWMTNTVDQAGIVPQAAGYYKEFVPGLKEGSDDTDEKRQMIEERMGQQEFPGKMIDYRHFSIATAPSVEIDLPSVSGGSKITNLNITIDSLVKDGINIHSTTVTESASRIKDLIVETLLTAVNDASLVAGN